MREAIINRIEALDRFYEQNYLDSTIAIFHMIKLKLKKAIFKIPNIYNETISIELMANDSGKQADSISKIAEDTFRKGELNSIDKSKKANFKI